MQKEEKGKKYTEQKQKKKSPERDHDHVGAGDDAALLDIVGPFLLFIISLDPWKRYFRSSRRRFKTSCFDSFSANVMSDNSVLRFCSSKMFSSIDS